jgi:uncharacterized membrane protein
MLIKDVVLCIMALLYLAAGVNHFVNRKWYLRIMPPWLPYHNALNIISGLCEIAFAIMLIPQQTRSIAAWLLIALLVAIFPANIQMSINYYKKQYRGFWFTILRLPLQVILIWWAYQYVK